MRLLLFFPQSKETARTVINGRVDAVRETHWREGNARVREVVLAAQAGRPGRIPEVTFITPAPAECDRAGCPYAIYKDDNHLRSSWVREHALRLDPIFH